MSRRTAVSHNIHALLHGIPPSTFNMPVLTEELISSISVLPPAYAIIRCLMLNCFFVTEEEQPRNNSCYGNKGESEPATRSIAATKGTFKIQRKVVLQPVHY